MKLLVIEDDMALCKILEYQLEKHGFDAEFCNHGADAFFYIEKQSYDTIVLDRMLPEVDGLTILKRLREKNITTPILLLTAMNTLENRVEGLDMGADDYLTKPFEVEELCARIRALSRRAKKISSNERLNYKDFTIDTMNYTIQTEKGECSLSKRECDLLSFFVRNQGIILTREMLLSRVWGADSFVTDGNLDNFIFFIRKRLKTVKSQAVIYTVRGVGYRLGEA